MILALTLVVLAQAPAVDVPRAARLPLAAAAFHDDRNPFGEFRDRDLAPEQYARIGTWSMIGGAALLAGGGASWGFAKYTEYRIRRGDDRIGSAAQLDATIRRGKLFEAVGWTAAGLGVVGVGVGYALFQRGQVPGDAALQLSVGPGYLGVSGGFR